MKQDRFEIRKRNLATWLQQKASKFSFATQKWMLVLVVVIVSLYCLRLITGDIIGSAFRSIEKNWHTDKENLQGRITAIENHLDSLKRTANGEYKVDSVLLANPGILDSIVKWRQDIENLK